MPDSTSSGVGQGFNYHPWTNWQGLLQGWFSPTITFGANIQDKPVEEHVLDKVGSYGKQLNSILDAMSVLVARADRKDLTPQEESAILKFEELARAADEAAAEFQGKPRRKEVTEAEVTHWLDAVADLRKSKPTAYEHLSNTIRNYKLPPVDEK